MYFDQFGPADLLRFALWLDHALGAIRIEKHSVRAEAPVNFLCDGQMNLLDVIATAFRPEAVLDYLKTEARPRADAIYDKEAIERRGVQLLYKHAVLRYYNQPVPGSLKGKGRWITDTFLSEKVAQA
jgi:hypothetical protein